MGYISLSPTEQNDSKSGSKIEGRFHQILLTPAESNGACLSPPLVDAGEHFIFDFQSLPAVKLKEFDDIHGQLVVQTIITVGDIEMQSMGRCHRIDVVGWR